MFDANYTIPIPKTFVIDIIIIYVTTTYTMPSVKRFAHLRNLGRRLPKTGMYRAITDAEQGIRENARGSTLGVYGLCLWGCRAPGSSPTRD